MNCCLSFPSKGMFVSQVASRWRCSLIIFASQRFETRRWHAVGCGDCLGPDEGLVRLYRPYHGVRILVAPDSSDSMLIPRCLA